MEEREFIRQIGLSWDVMNGRFRIGRSFALKASLKVDQEFNSIALSESSTYEEIYAIGLSRSHYNFILFDYAYFQFSYVDENDWRLAYYPNPRMTGVGSAIVELVELERKENLGVLTFEEVTEKLGEMNIMNFVPPIRYEYSVQQYKEISHPVSHFHIGRDSENRWPCSMKIGPYAFLLFIVKMYYSNIWAENSAYHNHGVENCIDQIFANAVSECSYVQDFSEFEKRSFHFSKNLAIPRPPVDKRGRHKR